MEPIRCLVPDATTSATISSPMCAGGLPDTWQALPDRTMSMADVISDIFSQRNPTSEHWVHEIRCDWISTLDHGSLGQVHLLNASGA